MHDELEFAIRELVVAIDHLVEVADNNPSTYDRIPDSMHHAVTHLMNEIAAYDWRKL